MLSLYSWIGIVLCLLVIIICLLVWILIDNRTNNNLPCVRETPYHWNAHVSDDDYLFITVDDQGSKRFSLGPQFLTYSTSMTGATGADEHYIMPMTGIMDQWTVSMEFTFLTTDSSAFPISITLKAIIRDCFERTAVEHLLMEPMIVYDSTQILSVCQSFRSPVKFSTQELISVVLDVHASNETPVQIDFLANRLFVSAIAEWYGS